MCVKAMDLTLEMVKASSDANPIIIEHSHGTFTIKRGWYGTSGGRELPGGTEYCIPVLLLEFRDRNDWLVGCEEHYEGVFQLLKLSILDKVRTNTFVFDKGMELEDMVSLWLHNTITE